MSVYKLFKQEREDWLDMTDMEKKVMIRLCAKIVQKQKIGKSLER